jgi:hypothetical protein
MIEGFDNHWKENVHIPLYTTITKDTGLQGL